MDAGAHCGANVFFEAVAGQKSGRRGKDLATVVCALKEQLLAPGDTKTNRFEAFDVLLFASRGLFVGDSDSELCAEPKQRRSRWENRVRTQSRLPRPDLR